MKTFVLAGNPNSGKTTLFNSLTGSTAHVGNWPGVTVEKREGLYKKSSEKCNIVDLPGIYSLSPYTSEEVISRDFILNSKPDCIINIVDATNLERNLYLTSQLLEINTPIIVALNMIDLVDKRGEKIDINALEKAIGVPVISISALKQKNLNQLMEKAIEESNKPRKGWSVLKNTDIWPLIDALNNKYSEFQTSNHLFHAIKMAEGDELEVKNHPQLEEVVNNFKKDYKNDIFGTDFEALIADARYKYITENFSITMSKYQELDVKSNNKFFSISDKIDRVLTNKWLGIPIFIAILFIVFHLVFSEDLFFLGAMGVKFTNNFIDTPFEGLFFTENGINSIGVMLSNFINSLTSLLNGTILSWLESMNVQSWAIGLVSEGVLGGIFAVIGFLPQILLLFLFFSILEDSGYMARVAFILDRLLRRFGVSGRAFMPMIMGFGCSVPAMINTRTLVDDKERIATIRVIPFFSCGAKLPILTAISGAMLTLFNVPSADLITLSLYFLGMFVAIIALILMKSTTMKGEIAPFVMELPNYHLPQFKSLALHLWDKIKHFITKAFTVIFVATLIIWLLSHFTWNRTFIESNEISSSILGSLGQFIKPLFTPLGFGNQLSNSGWVFAVAALTGLIAKEQTISTISVLALTLGAIGVDPDGDGIKAMSFLIEETGLTAAGAISFAAFNMLTIPCFASVATAKAELKKGTLKWTILFWVVTSYIVSSLIYTIGTWWWSLFIWLFVIILMVCFVIIFNKFKDKEILKKKVK